MREDRRPWPAGRVATGLACIVAIAAVGLLEVRLGGEATFSLFYVVPVSITAWSCRRGIAVLMAVYAIVIWSAADYVALGQSWNDPVPWWNAAVRLVFFIGVAIVVNALSGALRSERALARVDVTTGLANARQFMESAEAEARRLRRYGTPLCVAFCDVDNLKTVNDTLGHAAGDELLTEVAAALRSSLRQTDTVARLGGDEFGILLPDTDGEAAVIALGKARAAANAAIREHGWPSALSIGAVSTRLPVNDLKDILARADAQLYQIKGSGRDGLSVGAVPDREIFSGAHGAPSSSTKDMT